MSIPRSEHPNPQFERRDWLCLNGEWEFEIDKSNSGEERALYRAEHLSRRITVPFCPESKLSGIEEKDFMPSVWYKRTVHIDTADRRTVLHIGACDYKTTVYVNGERAGTHVGGYTPIVLDISERVVTGDNSIVIHAEDDTRSKKQPSGKQSERHASYGCYYTRTTGIWQTVFLEFVPKTHICSVKYYPSVESGELTVHATLCGEARLTLTASFEGRTVGEASVNARDGRAILTLRLSEVHPWELGKGGLYDLVLSYGDDTVYSYFGLRTTGVCGYRFLLNGKSVFQRTVLDQGYYPDGIYTAPTDEALKKDITLSMALGFNGARLHEKVFEPRFLYYCDKMGYMVWGEYANWGLDHTDGSLLPIFLREWCEVLERDFNHPSIIGWCPFNETWFNEGRPPSDSLIESVYRVTKHVDPTRPCIDTSGGFHVTTDVFDFHDYDQDPDNFRRTYEPLEKDDILNDYLTRTPKFSQHKQTYRKGQAVFASEYGGIKWDVEEDIQSWGYGHAPRSEEEFKARYEGLTSFLLGSKKIFGFCYTQLYDVEQEKNGLYTYDRRAKFSDMDFFRRVNTQSAAIEEE